MKLVLEKLISSAFILAIILLVVLGIFSYRSVAAINEAIELEIRTQGVLQKLDEALLNIVDSETGVRGFIITGNTNFLEPFNNFEQENATILAELKQMVKSNENQSNRLSALETLIKTKSEISNRQVNLRKTESFESAADIVANNSGKIAMDKIRVAVEEMKIEETSLLRSRELQLNQSFYRASLLLIGGTILGIVLLSLANFMIYSETRKRRLAEELLKNANRDLENRVEERTLKLAESNKDLEHQILRRKEAEIKQNTALEAGEMGIWTWNPHTNEYQADERTLSFFGLKTSEFENRYEQILSKIHVDDQSLLQSAAERSINLAQDFVIEFRVVNPDDSVRWIQSKAQIQDNDSAEDRKLVGFSSDITNRKESEIALRDSEQFNRSIFESSPDCVKVLDLDGKLISMNRTGMCIMEIDDFDMYVGKDWKTFWKDDVQEKILKTVGQALKGKTANFDGFCETAKGSPRWWEVTIAPIYDSNNKVIRLLSVSRDITERRESELEREKLLINEQQARQEAEKANRMRDEFLATVSHELRNPLNAMLGWARLLQRKQLDESNSQRAIETIVRNAESQNHLIEDMLDVSRIITGKLRLDLATIDPKTFVEAAVETVTPAAEAKNIKIQTIYDEGLNKIAGDANRLQQVIWNLLSNSIKFTPKNGEILVEAKWVDSMIEISVRDNGNGISKEFLPNVFDRFRQADSSTVKKFGGLGLGLAIVRHITEMHGGTVEAESEGEGKGATFTVKLPISAIIIETPDENEETRLKPPANASLTAPNVDLKGLSILTVDDEIDTCKLLEQVLSLYGARVTTALSAAEAFEEFQKNQPDIIISDIGMPEEDGYSLIRRIRSLPDENSKKMPAIALTAFARPLDRMKALSAGFQTHVSKPVEPDELATVIASLTGRLVKTE